MNLDTFNSETFSTIVKGVSDSQEFAKSNLARIEYGDPLLHGNNYFQYHIILKYTIC